MLILTATCNEKTIKNPIKTFYSLIDRNVMARTDIIFYTFIGHTKEKYDLLKKVFEVRFKNYITDKKSPYFIKEFEYIYELSKNDKIYNFYTVCFVKYDHKVKYLQKDIFVDKEKNAIVGSFKIICDKKHINFLPCLMINDEINKIKVIKHALNDDNSDIVILTGLTNDKEVKRGKSDKIKYINIEGFNFPKNVFPSIIMNKNKQELYTNLSTSFKSNEKLLSYNMIKKLYVKKYTNKDRRFTKTKNYKGSLNMTLIGDIEGLDCLFIEENKYFYSEIHKECVSELY